MLDMWMSNAISSNTGISYPNYMFHSKQPKIPVIYILNNISEVDILNILFYLHHWILLAFFTYCVIEFLWYVHFFEDFIYLFLEGKRERERNINVWLPLLHPQLGSWPTTQACTLTGNRTGNPLLHRSALNSLCHTNQG